MVASFSKPCFGSELFRLDCDKPRQEIQLLARIPSVEYQPEG
jgi:hypothetical protein